MRNNEDIFGLDGIQIHFVRKNVRNLSIRIIPPNGEVVVRVPICYANNRLYDFISKKREWILKSVEKVKNRETDKAKLDKESVKNFMAIFPELLKKWENEMGLSASKVSMRLMKSRWGSCRSQTRALTFNLYLAIKPIECVEYVIIHELAHIIHPNHSKDFWNLVSLYCPDYKRLRTLLNV